MRHLVFVIAVFFGLVVPRYATAAPNNAFATLEESVKRTVSTLGSADRQALTAMFGQVLVSRLEVPHLQFLKREIESWHSFQNKGPEEVVLLFGSERRRFPLSLRMGDDGWYFDRKSLKIDPQVWNNELTAIHICRDYVAAQRSYFRIDRNGDGVAEFATRFNSTPGYQDGLYWDGNSEKLPNPLGFLVNQAKLEGVTRERNYTGSISYHGYLYRILTSQGAMARAGARSYMINGKMTGGFALVARPTQWGGTGKRSFLIGQDEALYTADLGKDTAAIASAITAYDPGAPWRRLRDSEVGSTK